MMPGCSGSHFRILNSDIFDDMAALIRGNYLAFSQISCFLRESPLLVSDCQDRNFRFLAGSAKCGDRKFTD